MYPLISVIIPVYNTELYIDKCVQSVFDQTYKNLEIILINDGSTDSSGLKCEAFARLDSRVRVVHKQNGGQSSARNVGLDICKGEYISFVDSDDWIEPDMYSVLIEKLEKSDATLAVAGRYDVYENSKKKIIAKRLGENGVFDALELLPKMAMGQVSDFSVCDKLHKRSLWENVRFPEGEIYEDFAVMYKVLVAAKRVVVLDEPFYVYFHRKNSTVTSGFEEKTKDYPMQTERFLSYIVSFYPEYTNCAVWTHIKAIQVVLIKLFKANKRTYVNNHQVYTKYVKHLKKYRYVWEKDDIFTAVDRLICRVLLCEAFARAIFSCKRLIDCKWNLWRK